MLIYLATEDLLSEAAGDRLVAETGGRVEVGVRMGRRGNVYLRRKLPEFSRLASAIPVLLLTDLDRINCPPELISDWTGGRTLSDKLLFRVVVRQIETWLLADRDGFAEFAGIPPNRLPAEPEALDNAKQALLNLVRRHGQRTIRREIVAQGHSRSRVALGYNTILSRFVRERWSPERAASASDSLARARRRLAELANTNA